MRVLSSDCTGFLRSLGFTLMQARAFEMAEPKIQQELRKQYDTFSQTLDDEGVQQMIRESNKIMGEPARKLLLQAGLGPSTSKSFHLVDHACGTDPIAARLQETIRPECAVPEQDPLR